jgi:mono/diheme cytochrome c family protein
MPYAMYGNLAPNDAQSVALYLQSMPPQANTVPEDTAPPPPATASRLDDRSIPHTTLTAKDPSFDAAERGRYLAEVSCIDCHTQELGGGAGPDLTRAFAGGRSFQFPALTVKSSNLTPDTTGLAGWSQADLVATLGTDLERGTGRMLCAPMPGGMSGLGGLTAGDLGDLATYLLTLPPVVNGPFACGAP